MAVTEETRALAVPASATVTIATLARDWARPGAAPGGDAREGLRHLAASITWDTVWDMIARRRPRPAGPRRRARRPGVDPLRGPARVGDPRPRHRRRARHHGRAVPDQPGGRGRVPARRLRRHGAPRRGPGAGRQGLRRSTAGDCPTCARSSTSSRGAWSAYDDDRLTVLGGLPRAGPRAPGRPTRARSSERMAEANADDVMTLVYTSGTTGPPKGAMLTNAQRRVLHRASSSTRPTGCPTASRRTRAT